jgi:hypothetical protein
LAASAPQVARLFVETVWDRPGFNELTAGIAVSFDWWFKE